MRSVHLSKFAPVLVAAMLLTNAPGATVSAADEDERGSLCDVLSLDELHALGPLRYAEPVFGNETRCLYDESSDQVGPHTLGLSLRPIPFGGSFLEFRDTARNIVPGFVEISVGDQPGYIDATIPEAPGLIVGIDDSMLSITWSVGESAEGQGLDGVAYALAVAEIVVPRVAGAIDEERAAAAPRPPAVAGVTWTRVSDATAEEFISDDEVGLADLVTGLLEAHGADPAQARLSSATAQPDDAGGPGGLYLALRIDGVEGAQLVPGLLDWMTVAVGDEDLVAVETSVGGKQVTQISLGGQTTGFVYAAGDTMYLLSFPAELATEVLAQLP